MKKQKKLILAVCCLFVTMGMSLPVSAQETKSKEIITTSIPAPVLNAAKTTSQSPDVSTNNPAPAVYNSPDAELKEKLAKKISLDLRDMNVVDVLKFLAVKGGFNIVTSKDIEGRVTLLLNNVSIQDALEIILIANNLAYIQKNMIIYVMSGDEYLSMYGKKFNDNSKVKIVYLKYARPSYVLTALQNIRSNIGKIVVDEDTGTVVMIDTDEKIKEMEKAINDMEYKTETKVITLLYAKAETMANQLKSKLDAKTVGSIQFDERSNQIIITALPERLVEAEQIIKSLDVKTKAVLLEARILQVTLNPSYDTGINWEIAFKKSQHEALRSLDFASAFPIASTISGATNLTLGKVAVGNINTDTFAFELKALKQVEATKLLANPRIMVVNNQEARIHIGDTVPYVTTTTTGTGDTATTSETVNWINIGIQLLVTPTINDNGLISIKIKPEISSKVTDYETPKGAKIPVVNTTLVETTVIARDGQTVIIGGLVKNDKSSTHKGIPGLMNLPVLGSFFRNYADTVTNSEIVIFITPKIVTGDSDVPQQEGIQGLKSP
jgi:type II secretory pathway component GspD/PulD (secretin)